MDYYKGKRKNQIDFFNEFTDNNMEEMVEWIRNNKSGSWKNLSMDSKEYLLYDKFYQKFKSNLEGKGKMERRTIFVNAASLVH